MLPISRYEGTGYELAIRTLLEVRDILSNDRYAHRVANALAEINDTLADPSIEPDARSIEEATDY